MFLTKSDKIGNFLYPILISIIAGFSIYSLFTFNLKESNILLRIKLDYPENDIIQVYFRTSDQKFSGKNSITKNVSGTSAEQILDFSLPYTEPIQQLRIDIGDKVHKNIKIDEIVISRYGESITLSSNEFLKAFRANEFIKVKNGVINIIDIKGRNPDPYFISKNFYSVYEHLYLARNPAYHRMLIISIVASLFTIVIILLRRSKYGSLTKNKLEPALFTLIFLILLINKSNQFLNYSIRASNKYSNQILTSDSKHYYDIAKSFARGDVKMTYVKEGLAHRQPFYPFLLSLTLDDSEDSPIRPQLRVNVYLFIIFALLVFSSIIYFTKSYLFAALCSVFIIADPFYDEFVKFYLLTEPTYIFLLFTTLVLLLAYIDKKNPNLIYATSFVIGLCYLSRVNGLFLFISFFLILLFLKAQKRVSFKEIFYCTLIFVVVSSFSWVPRLIYHGNPIYHEYLSNFLWVDSYEVGHVSGPPRYFMKDYIESHGIGDVVDRIIYGIRFVFVSALFKYKGILALLFYFSALIILLFKDRKATYLLVFLLLQILPIIWTALSNPTLRIPYTIICRSLNKVDRFQH